MNLVFVDLHGQFKALKGQWRELFFYHSIVSRIESKDFKLFFHFGRTLAAVSVFGECAKIFQQLMRTLQGQSFNHGRWDVISEPQENKMQLKVLACPTG